MIRSTFNKSESADRLMQAIADVKHLPGRHNQRTHGRDQSGSGGGLGVGEFDEWTSIRNAVSPSLNDLTDLSALREQKPYGAATITAGLSTDFRNAQGDKAAEVFARVSRMAIGKELTLADIQDAYSGGIELLPPGFRVHVSATAQGKTVYVRGIIYDASNSQVGDFTRVFSANLDGSHEVLHDYFSLDKKYTNTGYGSEMFYKSEDAYRQWGIDAIKTHADIDVGGYAWARMGFDFADTGGESVNDVVGSYRVQLNKRVESALIDWYADRNDARVTQGRKLASPEVLARIIAHAKLRIDKLRYPHEFASFTMSMGGKAVQTGKHFMLGREWYAVKRLSDRTPNITAGDSYREIRLKKKHIKKSAVAFEDAMAGDYNDSEALDAVTSAADEAWRQLVFEEQPELLVDVVLDDDEVDKHLPGKHDQQDHGRKGNDTVAVESVADPSAAEVKIALQSRLPKTAIFILDEDKFAVGNNATSTEGHFGLIKQLGIKTGDIVRATIGANTIIIYSTESAAGAWKTTNAMDAWEEADARRWDFGNSNVDSVLAVVSWAKRNGLPGSTKVKFEAGSTLLHGFTLGSSLEDIQTELDRITKSGTSAGARAGWERRQRMLRQRQRLIDDLKARAAQTRDAKLMARANLLQANLNVLQGIQNTTPTGKSDAAEVLRVEIDKHLPGKHNQKAHGRFGSESINFPSAHDARKAIEELKLHGYSATGVTADIGENAGYYIQGLRELRNEEKEQTLHAEKFYSLARAWHNDATKETYEDLIDFASAYPAVSGLNRLSFDANDKIVLYRGGVVNSKSPQSWSVSEDWAKRFAVYGFGNSTRSSRGASIVTAKRFGRGELLAALPWEGEVIVKAIKVSKHLPGKHAQRTHGRDQSGSGGGIGAGGSNVTDLTQSPHYLRHRVGERQIEVMLKNGDKRTRTVIDFKFIDDTGNEVADAVTLVQLRKLAPPDVSNVVISRVSNSEITATWRDSKGRFHASYSKAHSKGAAVEKFSRLKAFTKALPKIRRQINEDLSSTDAATKETAEILYMIDKTGFRIGGTGETQAAVQAYGASTLLSKHVNANGDKVTFDFIGKKGVRIQKSLRDAKLAEIIASHKTSQWSQPLFENSNAGKVRTYLKRVAGDFVVKDFRTWNGTNVALRWIKKRKGPASSEAQFRKWQNEVGDRVSKHLGNSRSMALNAYIAPQVWSVWRKPEWGAWLPKDLREDKHLPGKHSQQTHGHGDLLFEESGNPPYDEFAKVFIPKFDGQDVGRFVVKFGSHDHKPYVIVSEAEVRPEFRGHGVTASFLAILKKKYPARLIAASPIPAAEGFWRKLGIPSWQAIQHSGVDKHLPGQHDQQSHAGDNVDLTFFNRESRKWLSGSDYESKVNAYDYAQRDFPGVGDYLRATYLKSKGDVKAYRVGIVGSGVTSYFINRVAADHYAQRFGVNTVREVLLDYSHVVPTGSGAGEIWADEEAIIEKHLPGRHDQKTHGHSTTGDVSDANAWVADSVVKDTFYHGAKFANADEALRVSHPEETTAVFGRGVYLTDDVGETKQYGANQFAVKVKAKNPLHLPTEASTFKTYISSLPAVARPKAEKDIRDYNALVQRMADKTKSSSPDAFKMEAARKLGYDAIIVYQPKRRWLVVPDPSQILVMKTDKSLAVMNLRAAIREVAYA